MERGHGVARVPHGGEEALGRGQEKSSRLREHGAAPDALEERGAELVLEQAHPPADGGLGEMEVAAARVKPPFRTMATNASTWSSSMPSA